MFPSLTSAQTAPPQLTAVQMYGQLSVKDTNIVDKGGKPVQLRGMSLFWSQWMPQYYNRDAVKWLRDDWHANLVRAAMAVDAGGYLTNPDAEKKKVEEVIDAAIENGIYVIIDWHDHSANQHQAQAEKFFGEIAQKYGDKPNVIYELFNEPTRQSWSREIKPYCEAVIKAIRRYDKDNIIVCGTPQWSQKVDDTALDPIKQPNIAYTLHYYADTHKQWLRNIAQTALKANLCLFVTEFGTCNANGGGNINLDETRDWWDFLDYNQISWCNWSVADKDETSAALKPGAAGTGGWTEDQISASGKLVREEMRKKNPPPPVLTPVANVVPAP